MTKREFLEAVITANLTEEVVAYANAEVVKMDERNAKRKNSPSKRSIENEPIKVKIREVLTHEPQSASEIAEKVEISTQKASALLRQIDGLEVTEIKVKGKGKVKGYAIG